MTKNLTDSQARAAATPTVDQIIDAVGDNAKPSRDGCSVVVGYGSNGYLRLTPSTVTRNGESLPAVFVEGRLYRRNGGIQADLRAQLEAAGICAR